MRKMTTAEARKDWAKVLRYAERGSPTVVTNNGQEIAAVVSMDHLRIIEASAPPSLFESILAARATIDRADLEGPDPWADVRDRAPGRDFSLE